MDEIILNSKYKKKILQINKSQLLKYLKNKNKRQNSLKIQKDFKNTFKFSKKSLSTLVTNENSKKNNFKTGSKGKIGIFVNNAYFKSNKRNELF